MRIPFACMLLLSATVLAADNERYQKFRNQHINNQMTNVKKCDQEMGKHKIKTIDNDCKETNTFILSTTKPVRAICEKAGKPFRQMTVSLQPFPIIVCKLKSDVSSTPCQYSGKRLTRYLVIRCENGFPVHFDRDLVDLPAL